MITQMCPEIGADHPDCSPVLGFLAAVSLLRSDTQKEAPAERGRAAPGTCAVLLQAADLGVQALQRAGVFALQKLQILLGALELVLQVGSCHPGMQ